MVLARSAVGDDVDARALHLLRLQLGGVDLSLLVEGSSSCYTGRVMDTSSLFWRAGRCVWNWVGDRILPALEGPRPAMSVNRLMVVLEAMDVFQWAGAQVS